MLHLKYNTEGKVVYAYEAPAANPTEQTACTVVPVVQNSIRTKKKIDNWYYSNQYHVSNIINRYIGALQDFCTVNSQYLCSIKESELRLNMISMLYNCSHSSFKSYPSL